MRTRYGLVMFAAVRALSYHALTSDTHEILERVEMFEYFCDSNTRATGNNTCSLPLELLSAFVGNEHLSIVEEMKVARSNRRTTFTRVIKVRPIVRTTF